MKISLMLLAALLGDGPQEPAATLPDSAQFMRLIEEAHSAIRDVSFMYEGKMEIVGAARAKQEKPDLFDASYSGTYIYRKDGSILQDEYTRYVNSDYHHNTYAILKDKMETLHRSSNDPRSYHVLQTKAVPDAVGSGWSPRKIFIPWYFQDLRKKTGWNLTCEAWEVFAGRRCLRILVDEDVSAPRNARYAYRFWMDMSRGGNALKVEMLRGEKVIRRADPIELIQVDDAAGKPVWFPLRGVVHSYMVSGDEVAEEPVFTETYTIMNGTVRVNFGVPDSTFRVDWKGDLESEKLAKIRKEFHSKPIERTDPASVEARLTAKLAEADAQAERVEASSPALENSRSNLFFQAGLTLLGVTAILIAIKQRRKA